VNAPKCYILGTSLIVLIIPNFLPELLSAYIYSNFVNFITYLSLLNTLLLVFTV